MPRKHKLMNNKEWGNNTGQWGASWGSAENHYIGSIGPCKRF